MSPTWNQRNLTVHYKKHPAGKDRECWQDLLQTSGQPVSEADYEDASLRVCADAWLCYSAESLYKEGVAAATRAGEDLPYYEERRYYIDDNLVTSVTSIEGDAMVTCFHEHYDHPHTPIAKQPPLAERREKYLKTLQIREQSKLVRGVERLS